MESEKPEGAKVPCSAWLGTLPPCDCLNDCGDDKANILAGKCEPCPTWKARQKAEAQQAKHVVLKRYYSVTTDAELIDAQAHQIERLQAKLAAATPQDSGKVRFARVG
jgi:predicted ATP-dependent serine protease